MKRICRTYDERYDDAGDLDVVITYDIDLQEYPAEPYSWGEGRGNEVEVYADVINVRIGDLKLSRADAELVFGKEHLSRLENNMAERVGELHHAGDLEAA